MLVKNQLYPTACHYLQSKSYSGDFESIGKRKGKKLRVAVRGSVGTQNTNPSEFQFH